MGIDSIKYFIYMINFSAIYETIDWEESEKNNKIENILKIVAS